MSDLNEQQMEAVDYVAVHGTLAAGLRIAKQQATITSLTAELAKHQGSSFHPDWSLLEATRDTVKELQATITEQRGGFETDQSGHGVAVDPKDIEIHELQATITKLKGHQDDPWTYWRLKCEELEAESELGNYLAEELLSANIRIEEQQATITELEVALEDIAEINGKWPNWYQDKAIAALKEVKGE